MKIGTMEFIVIFLVVFFVLGPEKTVLYARKLGKWLRVLKVYLVSLTGELRETIVEPLQEISEPLSDISKPLEELTKVAQQPLDTLNSAVRDLERPTDVPAKTPPADETKPEEVLEFAELEEAEPETAEDSPNAEPTLEAHVDADIEEAGDVKAPENESCADQIAITDSDFKT